MELYQIFTINIFANKPGAVPRLANAGHCGPRLERYSPMSNVANRRGAKLPQPQEDPDVATFRRAVEAHGRGESAEGDKLAAAANYARFGHLLSPAAIEAATGALITGEDRARILARA
jgi:hypothetical protein